MSGEIHDFQYQLIHLFRRELRSFCVPTGN